MKFKSPTKIFQINQKFGQNLNSYYKEGGQKGHSGLDLNCYYGEPIQAVCDGYVYSVLNKDNPNLMKYRAVYTIVNYENKLYEVSYGHAKDILVKPKQLVKQGDVLITGGNTGDVASGGKKITQEMKEQGSTAGTHLHFQVREVELADKLNSSNRHLALYDGVGYAKYEGKYIILQNRDNGFGGGIDPLPFFETPKLKYGLYRVGSRGEEVKIIQEIVGVQADGIFGKITERAVKAWQKKNGLVADGIVGRNTINKINNI